MPNAFKNRNGGNPPLHFLLDFLAEGNEGGEDHLEVLEAPGDAYDGDAEEEAEEQVEEGDLPPACQDPDQVHRHGNAAGFIGPVNEFVPERPEGVPPQFEELDAERDADKGDAHHESDQKVEQGDEQAAEQQPQKISKGSHSAKIGK